MADVMMFMLGIAWKIFGLMIGWMLLKHLMREGTGTFRELLDTAAMAIKAGCLIAKQKLLLTIQERKEANLDDQATPDTEPVKGQGTVR